MPLSANRYGKGKGKPDGLKKTILLFFSVQRKAGTKIPIFNTFCLFLPLSSFGKTFIYLSLSCIPTSAATAKRQGKRAIRP